VTEQELIKRCGEGNREAQQELYDRTSQHIYRLLLRMTGNPDDAFDLAQETYLTAFAWMGRFDGRSSVATWLYRVAVNEALQFLRRARRTRGKLQEIVPHNGIESDIERSTIRLDVNDALAAIAPTDRAMLLLRYQEGLDYRAIAEVAECAAGTVASRLNRARHALREALRKSYAFREESDHGEHPTEGAKVSSDPGRGGTQRRTGL
jgi:RNA polymerase sigma-70 factor (ECF subfamily)